MMLNKLNLVLLIILISENVNASNILVITAKDSGSHLKSLLDYLLFLADRGHTIHILDSVHKTPKNEHSNFITHSIHVQTDDISFEPWEIVGNNPTKFGNSYHQKDLDFRKMLEQHQKTINEIMDFDWDLVVVDNLFNPHGYSIALRLKEEKNVPFILFQTCGMTTTISGTSLALAQHPIHRPFAYPLEAKTPTDAFDPRRFIHRLYNALMFSYESFLFNVLVQHFYMPTIEKFGTKFSWREIFNKADFMFTDGLNGFKLPTSETRNHINIGTKCPKESNGELSKEILQFINNPQSKGTIYFAFGSYVKLEKAPERIIKSFVGTMKRLQDYRFVFVQNGKTTKLPSLPNVLYISWTNQVALLNHPKTLAFISHGGLKSIRESICSETPIIVLPLFADQLFNANGAVVNNYGRVLNKFLLTEQILHDTIKEIVDEPSKWKKQMETTKSVMLDKPIESLELAFFYTKKAIRNRQKDLFFKPKSIDQRWITYFSLDIFAILLAIILFIK